MIAAASNTLLKIISSLYISVWNSKKPNSSTTWEISDQKVQTDDFIQSLQKNIFFFL